MSAHAHVLLTKFNVALQSARSERPGLDADWLEQRFALFAAWTLPSVRIQTEPPTRWLIFLDAATPVSHTKRLAQLTAGAATLVPIEGPLSDREIGRLVRVHLAGDVSVLITSRLDSDDAIASTYLQTIKSHARGWTGFVNAPHGLQYADGLSLRRWDFRGPFLSRIERLENADSVPLTVFSTQHQLVASVGPVRQLSGGPMWMQVVHGANRMNRVSGVPYPRARAERALGWRLPPGAARRLGASDLARALYSELRWIARAPLLGAGAQLRHKRPEDLPRDVVPTTDGS